MHVGDIGNGGQARLVTAVFAAALLAVAIDSSVTAQQVVPGNNVNMVSGTRFPDGDPFLQRQNEPTMAVSTRNPLHLLAGSNDYRTVDLPGPFDPLLTQKMNADAWVGLFKSLDGGRTWQSTLLPGFPQDTSASGMLSPIKGRQAGTDAVVKAGTNGLFYYAGLAFDRGANMPSTIFVARYIDHNNRENGDPIAYAGTHVVDSDAGTRFLDKPSMAIDVPRGTGTCTITSNADPRVPVTETIPAGNVYLAYSAFTGSGSSQQSQILFSRSTDCGVTWSTPKNLSSGSILNQNAQIAVSPITGHVWVSWRRFRSGDLQSDGIFIARSTDGGLTFNRPVRVAPVSPFDQGTTDTSFRTNAFQTMAIDESGRVYVAWPERGHALLRPDRVTGDSRIVISTSTNGTAWTLPVPIEKDGLGHQLMPTLSFHAGKLRLIYYDLREDVSQIFGQFIDELPILAALDPKPPRHTIDAYVAQALPAAQPVFSAVRLSDYAFGTVAGTTEVQRLQYNPPNLPLFREGTAPFMGDYIDLAPAPPFVQTADGNWRFNTAPGPAISHGVWTDNRDVRAPANGDWTNYTPVTSPDVGTQSLFDPSQTVPGCVVGQTGMRNQNIYTAKVTEGLFVAAPGNSKPLGAIQRAFVIIIENARADARSYRLRIENQPPGGQASFAQFATPGAALTLLDASVPPYSTIARSVYVTSTESLARVEVSVSEITGPGGSIVPGGQSSTVVLNSDRTTPSIENPSIENPSIENPDIRVAEAYNPAITTAFLAPSIQNPSIENPSIENPSIENPSIENPQLTNGSIANPGIIRPSIENPSIENPSIENPSIENPSIENQDLVNGAISDTTWVVSNQGNTTASYAVKLLSNAALPPGFRSQLILHKIYRTPAAANCQLALQPHTVLLANIPNPVLAQVTDLTNPSIENPSIENATLSLAPGDSARVTLRVLDPNRFDGIEFDAGAAITPAAVAHSVNTEDAALGITTPRVAVPLTITTGGLAAGTPGGAYLADLQTFASVGSTSWTLTEGTLPPGVTLNPATGRFSGTPTTPGNYVFTVQAIDSNGNIDRQTLSIKIDPAAPSGYNRIWNGSDANWNNPRNWSPAGVPTPSDSVYISAAIPVMPMLTSDVTITNLLVESGATLDTNGFTLTLLGNGDAGNTIIGSGTVVMQGFGVTARGTYPNLTIGGAVRVVGPIAARGRLSLLAGASFDLNGHSMVVGGQLRTAAGAVVDPLISGDGATLTVGGVDVEGLILDRVLLIISGGLLQQFDEVRFINYQPQDVHVTVNHTGNADPFPMSNLSFFVVPTTGRYIQANDSSDDGNSLVVNVSASLPADGSTRSATQGGAVINWLFDPNAASVGVSQFVLPNPAVLGQPLTYTVVVANGGPASATGVLLTNPISGNASFQSASASQGTCSFSAGTVMCVIGTLAAGQSAVVTIVVIPGSPGSINNAVSVTANESDPATSDNSQTVKTDVVAAASAADLSITKLDSSDPVAVNAPFSYTVTVANAGPATATGVVVTDMLPAGLSSTGVTSSQGTCGVVGQLVTCELSSIVSGQQATVTINVLANAAGVATNTATVSSATADPTPGNNTATQPTLVGNGGPTRVPRVYVIHSAPVIGTPATLSVVDPSSGNVTNVLTVGVSAQVAALSPDGASLYVTNMDSNSVSVIDTATNSVAATITGTTRASGLVLNSDGSRAYVAGRDGQLFVINTATRGVIVTGSLGNLHVLRAAISPDNSRLWITDANTSNVVVVDTATLGIVTTIAVGEAPNNVLLTPDGARAYVVNGGSGTVSVIATDTNTVIATIPVGIQPDGLAFTPDGLQLYVSNVESDTISKIDVATNTVVGSIPVAGRPTEIAIIDNRAYVSALTGAVRVIDVTSNTVTSSIPTSPAGHALTAGLATASTGSANLVLELESTPNPANFGSLASFNAAVTNIGPDVATHVVITTQLPAGFALTLTDGDSCTSNGTTVRCAVGAIAVGDTVVLDMSVRVNAVGTLTTTARVQASQQDPQITNNVVSVTTTVNPFPATFTVTNVNDSGAGSLRAAITSANANSGTLDTIAYNIPGPGPHTIAPLSLLPTIIDPVNIDGTTQPGFSGTPVIELNGTSAGGAGLRITAGNSSLRGLVINRFSGAGIVVSTNGGNSISGNFIGTDFTGTVARGNGIGISIQTSAGGSTIIGGTSAGARNVVSGNTGVGIHIGGPTTNAVIAGNFIGTNAAGTAALGNARRGISIESGATGSIIGGTTSEARNVISANGTGGVLITGTGTSSNTVLGNYIGTDASGNAAMGNLAGAGIAIASGATASVIGGTAAGSGNLISANTLSAIGIYNGSAGSSIVGNLIGTTASGAPLGNANSSIYVDAPNTVIGGGSLAASNVIASTTQFSGIHLDPNATGTIIKGNFIGTDRTATTNLGGVGDGIYVASSNNQIGGAGPGEGNTIAFNGLHGIVIRDGTGNRISANSIRANANRGIELFPFGVTANDAGDADTGANNLQNFPVITSAVTSGATTAVQGTLNSTASTTFRLEFFSNTTCDSSGHGEGQTFVGTTDVTTNGSGLATFSTPLSAAGNVTATATDPAGNTSEFSACALTTGVDSYLVIPNRGMNALQVFDPVSRTILRTISLPSPYTFSSMLSTALVRPDGSIIVNARDGAGVAVALKISNVGAAIDSQPSGAEFLQQIAFDPLDSNRETVIGGTPFLPQVRAVSPIGGSATRIIRPDANFIGITTAANGNIYAGAWCGPDNGAVLLYDSAGTFISTFAQVGTATGSCEVNGLARDPAGNVYVAQNSSNRLAKFDNTGTFVNFITATSFNAPAQVFFNLQDGLLYVGNDADDRLTVLTPQGELVTVVRMGGSGIGVPGAFDGSNAPPLANAGPDQVVPRGSTVQLNGSGSSDPEESPLTYLWILNTRPTGSNAVLSATNIANPTFVADLPGTYVAQLVVNDGTVNSPSDTVTITTQNQLPLANAGADQANVPIGGTVTLDGSASSDPDGQPITYSWSFVQRPLDSTATLTSASSAQPTFVADRGGLYRLQLVVNDGQAHSFADTVDIVTINLLPTANAGVDQTVLEGATVQLSGAASSDPDQNPLTYAWTLVGKPVGSTAVLSGSSGSSPSFVADLPGLYTARLVVNDGFANSAPDDVLITATSSRIVLSLVGTPLLGVSRQGTLAVTLPTPAPPGGVTVTVASDDLGLISIVAPGTAVIAEGASTGTVLVNGVAVGTTTLRATAPGYLAGSTTLGVTNSVLTLPASLNVAFGQTASLPVNLAQAAPAGGVVVTLTSSAPGTIEVVTPTITIPEGALSANGTARGVGIGTATVAAENPNFASAASLVSSTGSLNIIQTFATMTPGFPTSVTIQLESGGSPVGAPSGGIQVTLSAANPACIATSTVVIPQGVVNVVRSLTYGGTAPLPCTTTLSATASNLTTDSINVTVDPEPGITLFSLPARVGGGLQKGAVTARLGVGNHGGVTMRIRSSDPAIALVSPAVGTPGTEFIDVAVPDGSTDVSYYIHGTSAQALGTVTLTASAPGFTNGTGLAEVAAPQLTLSLGTSVTSVAADVPFQVSLGVAHQNGTFIQDFQGPRAGTTLPVTITNSNAAVAQLRTSAGAAQSRTLNIAAGQASSPFGIANGGITFDPLGGGSTTVAATAPGAGNTLGGSVNVSVSAPGISLFSLPARVGGGLQKGPLTARLEGSAHGGVTLRIRSSDPAVALVSSAVGTAGSEFIDVVVPDGSTDVSYYIHGTNAQALGTVTLTASAPGFTNNTGLAEIVVPQLTLSLGASITSLAADVPFQVSLGVAHQNGTFIQEFQGPRAGTTLAVTITNSNAAVAQLRTSAGAAQSRILNMSVGQATSPFGIANGGIAFDPVGGGSTTVSATAPGAANTLGGSVNVVVSAPGITLFSLPARVGGGLQKGPLTARLEGSAHGGVTLRIRSSDPAIALVSPAVGTAGTEFIDVAVPDSSTDVSYYIHGTSAQALGTVTLTASAPGFTNGTGLAEVAVPQLTLSLGTSVTSLAADVPFQVSLGVAHQNGTFIQEFQGPRAGTTLPVTITNSNAAVAQLRTSAGAAQSRILNMPAGQASSPFGIANGGIAFDPLSGGSTTVAATAPGAVSTLGGSVNVVVSAPGITLFSLPARVGGGLQKGPLTARLGGTNHGGVTLRLISSNPAVMLLSAGAGTAGSAVIDIPIADGQTDAGYYIHGVSPTALATVTVTASAAGFSDETGTVTIAEPHLTMNLGASTTSLSADTAFQVSLGVANQSRTFIQEFQAVRAGTTVEITVTNSNATAGQLRTSAGAAQARAMIVAGGSVSTPGTVAAGGVAFDPLAAGSTTVAATATGFNNGLGGTVTVTVTSPDIQMFSLPVTVGAGLQSGHYTARLGGTQHGGVTMRIASSNAAVALISPDAVTPGTAFIDVSIANGQTDAAYYIQGTSTGSTGTVTITASAPAFTSGTGLTHVATAALQIDALPSSIDATAASVPFRVRVGLPTAGNGSLQLAQNVRAGSSLVATVVVTHSDGTASQLVTSAGGAQARQVTITGNNASSPSIVANGGVAFDPLTAGLSVVSATIPGVTTTTAGQVMVEVTASLVGSSTGKTAAPVKKKGG